MSGRNTGDMFRTDMATWLLNVADEVFRVDPADKPFGAADGYLLIARVGAVHVHLEANRGGDAQDPWRYEMQARNHSDEEQATGCHRQQEAMAIASGSRVTDMISARTLTAGDAAGTARMRAMAEAMELARHGGDPNEIIALLHRGLPDPQVDVPDDISALMPVSSPPTSYDRDSDPYL